jgi:hypothetical protein
MADDGNALTSMADVKETIMLSGGVIASMALSLPAFGQFTQYVASAKRVFSPIEDLTTSPEVVMHAIFCYGWRDNPRNTEEGWWLCKNRSAKLLHAQQLRLLCCVHAQSQICLCRLMPHQQLLCIEHQHGCRSIAAAC